MGEIADDLIEGRVCSWCGIYFTKEHSFPVVCKGCWKDATSDERKEVQKAIYQEE
jgi:hypothetical protein